MARTEAPRADAADAADVEFAGGAPARRKFTASVQASGEFAAGHQIFPTDRIPMKTLYTAEALASGEGRDGTAVTKDGKLSVNLASPVELGGNGEGTNPEQLFAAGYAACFHSALRLVGRQTKADLTDSAVAAKIHLGALADGPGYGIAAELEIALPAVDRKTAEDLVARAHEVCPYSNATRGNITVDIKILEVAA